MSNKHKQVTDVLDRLTVLEQKVQKHLEDGVIVIANIEGLRANIRWLTWLTTVIAGGILVQAILVIIKR